jgi:hypothetical protein
VFKFKAQNIPVGVQFQPDRVKKGRMPGYGFLLFRFVLPSDNIFLPIQELYPETPDFAIEAVPKLQFLEQQP